MDPARPAAGEELLRHQAFVRRLARELVRDAAQADDLVQDAWLQALLQPPRVAAAARAWFRTVLRNLAHRTAREGTRRADRELRAARDEAQPSPLEIEERLSLERRLVQAVEDLREPYRSAVYRRYFENLSPRAIAARESVPLATVKTRLRRALELLREALDRSSERRTWVLGLVRLVRPELVTLPLAAPLLATAITVAGLALWTYSDAPRERVELAGLASFGEPAAAGSDVRAVDLLAPEIPLEPRVSIAPSESPVPESQAGILAVEEGEPALEEPAERAVLLGRVLFPDFTAAADANVLLGPFSTRTDSRGWFELVLESEPVTVEAVLASRLSGGRDEVEPDTALVALLDGWTPAVLAGAGALAQAALQRSPSAELEPVELVLPARELALGGTLLDPGGAPATGWRTSLLDGTPAWKNQARPFTAEELASGTGLSVEKLAEGRFSISLTDAHVTGTGTNGLLVSLTCGPHTEIGADGRFRFRGLTAGRSYRVRAWNPHTLEQLVSEPILAGTEDLVLRAPNDPWRPSVDGVVVDPDGAPLAGVRCRLTMVEYESGGTTWMTTGQEVETDDRGRFAFVDVPPTELFIRFDGHGSGGRFDLPPEDPGRNLRIELERESSSP